MEATAAAAVAVRRRPTLVLCFSLVCISAANRSIEADSSLRRCRRPGYRGHAFFHRPASGRVLHRYSLFCFFFTSPTRYVRRSYVVSPPAPLSIPARTVKRGGCFSGASLRGNEQTSGRKASLVFLEQTRLPSGGHSLPQFSSTQATGIQALDTAEKRFYRLDTM